MLFIKMINLIKKLNHNYFGIVNLIYMPKKSNKGTPTINYLSNDDFWSENSTIQTCGTIYRNREDFLNGIPHPRFNRINNDESTTDSSRKKSIRVIRIKK